MSDPRLRGNSTIADAADFQDWLAAERAAVDALLSDHLNRLKLQMPQHGRLFEAVRYSWTLPGKRIRPILVRAAAHACGLDPRRTDAAALAIEAIHAFSLIHDDLPAMDDDDVRRGQPTNHKVFGEAVAILAGDWLQPHAFALLAEADWPAEVRLRAAVELANATRAMVVGQAADIAGEQLPTDGELVRFIHRNKTSRLIEAACRLGAIVAEAEPSALEAFGTFGRSIGLAFQIRDDLLDFDGDASAMGKRVAKDAEHAKQTFPAAFGTEESRRRAGELIAAAYGALAPLGERASRLRALADFVLSRKH